MPSWPKPNAGKIEKSAAVTKKLLSSFPDYGKEPVEYTVTIAEALSYLSESDLALIADPVRGLATKHTYLPTVGDIHKFLAAERERVNQFKPAHTAYRRFGNAAGDRLSEVEVDRRKRLVRELLGYDPQKFNARNRPVFETIGIDAFHDAGSLKTPPRRASPELIELLTQQGMRLSPLRDGAA
jgi:hypothetical protein